MRSMRRKHDAGFKAKVALEAVKGEELLSIVVDWDDQATSFRSSSVSSRSTRSPSMNSTPARTRGRR